MKLKQLTYALASALFLMSNPASAVDISGESFKGSIDTTVSYGVAQRVSARDQDLIGFANGGKASSVNGDDGNLNYDKNDLVSNVVKVTSEMELDWGTFGAFIRGTAFYDFENQDGKRAHKELSSDAKKLVGSDIDLLDAYVWKRFDINGKQLDLRLGNQLLSWGESTFIQNSINSINPVDVAKLRVPGAELREALVPVPMATASLETSANSSAELFYQLKWKETEVDPSGSYFSTTDYVGAGGDRVVLGYGRVPDNYPANAKIPGSTLTSVVARNSDNKPKDSGQYGLAFRFLAEQINNTEFGMYYMNYHSRLPLIGAYTGSAQAAAGLDANGQNYVQTARYVISYPEDIQLYGASFNTSLGNSGIALQGELSYRKDMPLQVDDSEILFAALGAQDNLSPNNTGAALFAQQGQYGRVAFDSFIPGYIRRDVSQAQVTASKMFGPAVGASSTFILGEVGVTNVINMPDKDQLRLDASGTSISGNANMATLGAAAGIHPNSYESADHFADKVSWGYRMLMRMQYDNVFAGVNLVPSLAFQHDVNGISPGPAGNFLEGRKAVTIGLGANYLNKYSADISYTNYSGAGAYNAINDRDFIAANVKYSF